MRPIDLWFGALLLLAVACGGDVEEPGPDGGGGQSVTSGSPTAPGAASATNGNDPTTKTQLGDCTSGTPGTSASSAETCPWYARVNGITCYPSLEQACNCICPTNIASSCVPDWPEDGKPTLVYCSK